jgi:hypothetical protein
LMGYPARLRKGSSVRPLSKVWIIELCILGLALGGLRCMNHHDPLPINVKHAHVLTSMFFGLVRVQGR